MADLKIVAIEIPQDQIIDFCQRHHVARLALFGSVLGSGFGPDSDVDVLLLFEPGTQVGFIKLSRMQRELSLILGHVVDLVPESGLKPFIRDEIVSSSQVIYAPVRSYICGTSSRRRTPYNVSSRM
jgi:predicted nucleotidyltransferase